MASMATTTRDIATDRMIQSHSKDRQGENKQYDENHQENIKQDAGYIGACNRYAGKAKKSGNE